MSALTTKLLVLCDVEFDQYGNVSKVQPDTGYINRLKITKTDTGIFAYTGPEQYNIGAENQLILL